MERDNTKWSLEEGEIKKKKKEVRDIDRFLLNFEKGATTTRVGGKTAGPPVAYRRQD